MPIAREWWRPFAFLFTFNVGAVLALSALWQYARTRESTTTLGRRARTITNVCLVE